MADLLITGATGFVGSHLVEALAADGTRVRAVVRRTSNLSILRRLGVEIVVADGWGADELRRAVDGVDTVFHLAAATRAVRRETFREVNAEGTRRLVRALDEAGGARRLIYLSSLAAVGPGRGAPVDAGREPQPLTAYGQSKLDGERNAQAAAAVSAIVLRAPAVYGPGDRNLLPFFRLARFGLLPVIGDPARRIQFVHVADLTRALVLAWRSPAAGTFHVAEPEAYTWAAVLDLLAAAVGRSGIRLPVPAPMLAVAAGMSELTARITARPTIFDRDKCRELLADWICDTDAARRELGFEAGIPLGDGLRDTAVWYRTRRWL